MMEVREKIKTTDEEFESVIQNDRPTLSEELYNTKHKGKRCSFDPVTGSFEEFMETYNE